MASFNRALSRLARRFRIMVARGVLELVKDDQGLQEVQITLLAGEVRDDVERVQEYGFTSVPHPGAEAVALAVGGRRNHTVVIATEDRRYRIKSLADGEVCLYTDEDQKGGHRVHLKRGNEIHLVAGVSSIVMTPSGITMTAPAISMVKG